MLFDSNGLKPTYLFKIGSPGSSFAFELAKSNGLPKAVIHHAEQKLGSKKYKVDKLLNDLQSNKNALEKQVNDLQQRERKLDKLIANYENQMTEFEIKRKKLRQEVKEFQLSSINAQSEILDSRIKELTKENNLDSIRALAIKKKEEREKLIAEVETLNAETNRFDKKNLFKENIEAGDFVRLKPSGTTGNVIEVIKENAKVSMGGLTVLVPLTQLQVERAPEDLRRTKTIFTDIVTTSSQAKDKIDIRGLKVDEAMQQIQEFFDLALIAGKINVEILHGKGNGTLKRVVRQKLKEYKVPMTISHPAPEAGGDGITIVQID
jgi:DNA mismatch repair protein MutS2